MNVDLKPMKTLDILLTLNFVLLQFYLSFLIIEIMFLIPWCISISKINLLSFWSMIDFLLELGIGFYYIWYVKALNWD